MGGGVKFYHVLCYVTMVARTSCLCIPPICYILILAIPVGNSSLSSADFALFLLLTYSSRLILCYVSLSPKEGAGCPFPSPSLQNLPFPSPSLQTCPFPSPSLQTCPFPSRSLQNLPLPFSFTPKPACTCFLVRLFYKHWSCIGMQRM